MVAPLVGDRGEFSPDGYVLFLSRRSQLFCGEYRSIFALRAPRRTMVVAHRSAPIVSQPWIWNQDSADTLMMSV